MIGLHPGPVRVQDSEAIGVAVGCQADGCFLRDYGLSQGKQVLFGHVRARAIEQDVAVPPQGLHVDALRCEHAIQVPGPATMQSVRYDADLCIADCLEIDEFHQAFEIGIARVDLFKRLVVRLRGRALAKLCRARFDVSRHFRQRRAAVGPGKFQALIFGWIVAGGKIDRAIGLAPADFIGDGGRGRRVLAEQDMNSVLTQNLGGGEAEFLAEETCIAPDNERRFRVAAAHMAGNGRRGKPDVGERKILRDDCSPTRRSKFDRSRHFLDRMFLAPAKYCSVACKWQTVLK